VAWHHRDRQWGPRPPLSPTKAAGWSPGDFALGQMGHSVASVGQMAWMARGAKTAAGSPVLAGRTA
jgi:hypothetical protein